MKPNQFEHMIRAIVKQVVSEEIRRQLPEVVTEIFLKKLVSEVATLNSPAVLQNNSFVNKQAKVRKLSLEQTFEQEMARIKNEQIPEPMDNSDEGIYQDNGVITRKNENVRNKVLADRNSGPYASMFEDVIPVQGGHELINESSRSPELPLIPPTNVTEEGHVVAADPGQYGDFYKKMIGAASEGGLMKQSPEAELRRLEAKRRELDSRKA